MSYGELESGKRLTEHELRREMVRVGRLMWERGYVAATDGNLSARLGSNRLLVTASGLSKGFLSDDDLIVIGLDGEPVSAYRARGKRPSSEISMHLEVYRQRPDVNAVVHAHPPLATAFSIAGVSLARCVIPEVIVSMRTIAAWLLTSTWRRKNSMPSKLNIETVALITPNHTTGSKFPTTGKGISSNRCAVQRPSNPVVETPATALITSIVTNTEWPRTS